MGLETKMMMLGTGFPISTLSFQELLLFESTGGEYMYQFLWSREESDCEMSALVAISG
jgi:hypothetical protein